MSRSLTVFLLLAASCSRQEGLTPDEFASARRTLAERRQPWWRNHAPETPNEPLKIKSADQSDWASMNYFPPGTPLMPIDVARALQAKAPIFKDTPFDGRTVLFVDVRPKSDFYVDSIPGSRNLPVKELAKPPENLDRKAIVVVAGEEYPHHEVIARIRSSGVEVVYTLEGGLKSWRARGFPLDKRNDVGEYRRLVEAEREPGDSGPSPDFMGVGPLGLKSLMDAGADLTILFVGDEMTYDSGHIPGAIRAPIDGLEPAFKGVPKDKLIAVYCGCCAGRAGGFSEDAARRLRKMGYTRVLHLDGHLGAWREAGYPVVGASAK